MSGHTPGPWEISEEDRDEWRLLSVLGGLAKRTVAQCGHPEGSQNEANACLIAAAPDLLEALKLAEPYVAHVYGLRVDSDNDEGAERALAVGEACQRAIAKAEGK